MADSGCDDLGWRATVAIRATAVLLTCGLSLGCSEARSGRALPSIDEGPAGLEADWVSEPNVDDLVQIELRRRDQRVVIDDAWSRRFDIDAAWSVDHGDPILWVGSPDEGTNAYRVVFPEVYTLNCLVGRAAFELLLATALPDELDDNDVRCR